MKIEDLGRTCLRSVEPYRPGKPIAEVQRELGLKKVVKLASNENSLGASPKALAEMRRAVKDSYLYPEGASPLLRRALAAAHGVSEPQVIIGNGSDEVIRLLCEAFLGPDDEVVCSQAGFIRFKQQSMLMGAGVVEVPMRGVTHDLEAMARAMTKRTKLVFVASPNNPTGTYNTQAEVEALLAALPPECLLVLDEAYAHYAAGLPGYPASLPGLVKRWPNLFVLRTFSKAYGLAGLRVGYGVGDAGVVAWLDRIRMPFNVALASQRAALAALHDEAFLRRSVSVNAKNRRALVGALCAAGLKTAESATNFLLCESPLPGAELFKRLLARGVIVRPLDEYGLAKHVRISVGSTAQNRFLLAALGKSLPEAR
ncbi:MAG: histidinol-phosphate transaminase [Elusimicrobia bacterium]|nr:histidinol-phosphate transaminase [Elusimicrobiota bacterium]